MVLSQVKIIGRYSAKTLVLFCVGIYALAQGLRFSVQINGPWPPPESPSAMVYIDSFFPVEVWGIWWLVAGIVCLFSAAIPHDGDKWRTVTQKYPNLHYVDSIGPALFMGISCIWGAAYLIWFINAFIPATSFGNDRAWLSAVQHFAWVGVTYAALIIGKGGNNIFTRLNRRRTPTAGGN